MSMTDHSQNIETLKEKLALISGDNWFQNDAKKEVLIRYYSFPTHDGQNNDFLPEPGTDIHFNGQPFRAVMCTIGDQPYATFLHVLISSAEGPQMAVEKINRMLPKSTYVLVTTPSLSHLGEVRTSISS